MRSPPITFDMNWKSSEELKIKMAERTALILTMNLLKFNLKEEYDTSYGHLNRRRKTGCLFNMDNTLRKTRWELPSGLQKAVIADIAGWMYLCNNFSQRVFDSNFVSSTAITSIDEDAVDDYIFVKRSDAIRELAFPCEYQIPYDDRTEKQLNWEYIRCQDAINVIDHFLKTGVVDWNKFIGKDAK